jgi:hypothetical protein
MIGSCDTVARAEFVEVTVTDYVAQFRRIPSIIDSSLVIDFTAYIRDLTEFNRVIVPVKENSHAGSVVDVAFAYPVANTIDPDTGPV